MRSAALSVKFAACKAIEPPIIVDLPEFAPSFPTRGAPMQGEKEFIPIWIKDARRGARTSGDVPPPVRGVPKRPCAGGAKSEQNVKKPSYAKAPD